MVKIPSLSRRSEPTRDENLDGRIDGRDTPAATGRDGSTETGAGRSEDGDITRPVVTDRDADQTTYRSSAATGDQAGEAERRAAERAAVARAAAIKRPVAGDPDPTLERTVDRGAAVDLDRDAAITAGRSDGPDRDRTGRGTLLDRDHGRAAERNDDLTSDGVRREDEVTERAPVGPKPRASMLATLGLVVAVAGALFVLTGTLAGYGIGLGAVGAVLSVLGLMATRRRHIAGKTDALLGILLGLAAVVLGVLAMTGQFDWPTTDGDWVQRFREWLDSQFVDRF
ncbi:thrombospondin [Micromonospora sp. GCM10011542]|uniref:thrombospondin n=1 Tax=Micromonospora sp. GCM10011542 TaxID=3317337 RepID=UPI00360ED7EF